MKSIGAARWATKCYEQAHVLPRSRRYIHLNFAPTAGREFTGPHYGLVISTIHFSRGAGLCIVLPATTKFHEDQRLLQTALMIELPPLEGLK